jgi:putative endonuclease
MFYVYLLQSKKLGKIYTGYSTNLKNRLRDHLAGSVHTTSRMGEIELVYYEAFKSKIDAQRREKYLKTTKGKRMIKLLLKDSLV